MSTFENTCNKNNKNLGGEKYIKMNSQKQHKKIEPTVRSKFKLNYKHYSNTNCRVACLLNFLKSEARNCHRPYPISQGSVGDSKQDPVLTLVKKKQEYQMKMEKIKYMYQKYQKQLQISKQFQSYRDMQAVLSQDPDNYFFSNYNWYYTGGNLIIEEVKNTKQLFHITNNTELCVAKLRKKDAGWIARKKNILSTHSSTIYQLDSVNNNLKTIVGVRQKNDILLYDVKLNETGKVVCELANIQNTEIPFVSMCLNAQNFEEYAAVNANQSLQIWDLCRLKPACVYEIPFDIKTLEGDCFAQVSYSSDSILSYINRTQMYIFDKRSNCISSSFKLDSTDILDFSDRFVNICPQRDNSFLYYMSTFRDILLFDVRYKNVISKYSHSFTSAPLISDITNDTNNNIILCISSCKPDEKLILEQNNKSYGIPVSLPSITDSFESSLLQSSNMNNSLRLRERLDVSTTGLRLWPNDSDTFTVFSANVFGDIYCHEITKHPTLTESKKTNHFQKWNDSFLDNENGTNPLNFVDKVVLNDIKFTFDTEPPDLMSFIKNKRLQDCVQDLKKCKKGYSAKICNVWENAGGTNALDGIEQISSDVTVRNWLSQFGPQQEEPET